MFCELSVAGSGLAHREGNLRDRPEEHEDVEPEDTGEDGLPGVGTGGGRARSGAKFELLPRFWVYKY